MQKASKIKRNDREVWHKLFQSLKFNACVQEVLRPDQHGNLGQLNSSLIFASCHFSMVDLFILDWWDPTINCEPPTQYDKYILLSCLTMNDRSGKARWKWLTYDCMVGWVVRPGLWHSSVTSVLHTSPNHALRSIRECPWTFRHSPKTAKPWSVGEMCLA